MALRIKELCKEKHITMAELAGKIGINPVTLTQSLNGNPTLNRLQEVADSLGVDISELFVQPIKESVFGCLYINGKPTIVNSKEQVLTLLKDVE
jgi:transcriptional regulator with XRE-family HTH domain